MSDPYGINAELRKKLQLVHVYGEDVHNAFELTQVEIEVQDVKYTYKLKEKGKR